LRNSSKPRRNETQLEAPTTARRRVRDPAHQSHGITVNGCFILGLDGQTPRVRRLHDPDATDARRRRFTEMCHATDDWTNALRRDAV